MFNKLNLSEEILRGLEIKGFEVPTDIQTECIPLIVDGKDVLGRSQTGSGKTFAFGLPAIDKIDTEIKNIQVLVVCPTRELAMQVTDEMRKITEFKPACKIVSVYGGANIDRQIKSLKTAKIVVGTPGRLMDHMRRKTLKLHNLKMVVLDEADEMLNMGFRDDIENILKFTPKQRQTVMFSATMPPAIKAITREYMVDPQFIEIGKLNSTLTEIEQSFIKSSRGGKKAILVELFETLNPQRTIVFCNTKRMVDDIKKLLNSKDINTLALHGDMRQSERKRVMEAIKTHKVSTLVATDVAARGIDINDVEYIINFDIPKDVEYYIHRIGRTGRAGKSGKAISLINTKEQLMLLLKFKELTKSKMKEHSLSNNDTQLIHESKPSRPNRQFRGNNKPKANNYKSSWGKRSNQRQKKA